MRIVVTGATGFIGAHLSRTLSERGDEVIALSRDPDSVARRAPGVSRAYAWDPMSEPAPAEALEQAAAVVHLAGESVVGRWSEAKRRAIRDTRVLGTRNLVAGIVRLENKPQVLVSASAIGFYGDRAGEELSEQSSGGNDYLASVCRQWEEEALKIKALGVRLVRIRTGIVLARDGGALGAMLLPFQLGLGGPLGSGQQWWSWIHRDDLVTLIIHSIDNKIDGIWNGTAPNPVTQKEFARVLGRVLRRPAFLPAPAFALKLILGGFAAELLSSKKALPRAPEASGVVFKYRELEPALREILDA